MWAVSLGVGGGKMVCVMGLEVCAMVWVGLNSLVLLLVVESCDEWVKSHFRLIVGGEFLVLDCIAQMEEHLAYTANCWVLTPHETIGSVLKME